MDNSLVNDEIVVAIGIINGLDMKQENVIVQVGTQNYHLERVSGKL